MKVLYDAIFSSAVSKYSVYLLNFSSLMILARVFTPESFGTIAAVALFYLIAQVLCEFGCVPTIVNLKDLSEGSRDKCHSAFVITGVLAGSLLFAIRDLIAGFYENSDILHVTSLYSLAICAFAIGILPGALIIRQKGFYHHAMCYAAGELISTLFCLLSLRYGHGLEFLASKQLVANIVVSSGLVLLSSRYEFGRPELSVRCDFSLHTNRASLGQLGFNAVNFVSRNIDNLLVGKYLGLGSLGLYDRAYQLMRYPLLLLSYAVAPAVQPVINKMVSLQSEVLRVHQDLIAKLLWLSLIPTVIFSAFSDELISVLFGDQWLGVSQLVTVFSLAVPVQVCMGSASGFFQAYGRTDLLFWVGVRSAISLVACIALGIYFKDLVLLAWFIVLGLHFNFIQTYATLYRKIFRVSLLIMAPKVIIQFSLLLGWLSVLFLSGNISVES